MSNQLCSVAKFILCSFTALILHNNVFAQDKNKTITLVVPFSPGGSTDITARSLADKIRPLLGGTIVVENKAGAGGNIGAFAVARANADGNTLLMATSTHVTNMSLYKNLQYDFVKDLTPISRVAFIPNTLVINKDLPVNNLSEFVQYVKDKKGPVNYGSAGNGTSQHLAGALFNSMAGGNMVHIPYKAGGPAVMLDLMSGQVQAYFAPLAEVTSFIDSGKVKVLGVTTKERSNRYPNVQAINEVMPGYEVVLWNGILTTANAPPDQINRINAAISKALQDPELQKKLADQGSVPAPNSVADFKSFIQKETAKWAELVKISGAAVE